LIIKKIKVALSNLALASTHESFLFLKLSEDRERERERERDGRDS